MIFSADQVPLVTDPAPGSTGRAVLSAIAHGREPVVEQVFPALLAALQRLGKDDLNTYNDLVLAGLPADARTRWRDYMTTTIYRSTGTPYLSEEYNASYTKGRDEGRDEGRGEGQAIGLSHGLLTVLDARGIKITKVARKRIESTTDSQLLDTWLRRAATAATVKEVLAD